MTPTLFGRSTPSVSAQAGASFSPLVLADRLISLAQEADRAGYSSSASRLIGLVYAVLDDEEQTNAARVVAA